MQSLAFAKAIVALDIPERSCVTISGHNTPEHFMAILGTVNANCIFSDLYLTNSADACLAQINHSDAKLIVCDTLKTF